MAKNYLFKVYKTDDYISIAEETARWIKTTEKITPYGKRWNQSPDSEEDFSDYPMLTEKALYIDISSLYNSITRTSEIMKYNYQSKRG